MKTNDIPISLPSSKSLSIRWLLVGHLCGCRISMSGLSDADDVKVLRRILTEMPLTQSDNHTNGQSTIHCGESAAVARFLLAILASRPLGRVTLDGGPSLLRRPMAPLVNALRSMGGNRIEYLGTEGCLPLMVEGGWPEKKLVEVDPSLSGQFVSALAIAGAALPRGLHVRMTKPPASRSYIEMTCSVLAQAGAANDYKPNHTTIRIEPFANRATIRNVNIERDWSAASFFYMAAVFLPRRRIRLVSLTNESLQGDRVAADLFQMLGVNTIVARSPYRASRSLVIEGGGEAKPHLLYDFTDCPDLVIPIAVTCAAMGVEAWLSGLQNLQYKECDRLDALTVELRKMGAAIDTDRERIHILPSVLMPSRPVCTYGDHRMAMAFGALSLLFPNLVIDRTDVVSKSFPDFWQQLDKIVKCSVVGS